MATTRDFARIAIIQPELVEGRAMCLSEAGKNKLQSSPREGPAASNEEPGTANAKVRRQQQQKKAGLDQRQA